MKRYIINLIILVILSPCVCLSQQTQDKGQTIVSKESIITEIEARLALARVLSYNEDTLDEALEEYKIILDRQPQNPDALMGATNIYIMQKRYSEAIENLNIILAQRPDDYEANLAAGKIYMWLKEYDKAIQAYNTILQRYKVDAVFYSEFGDLHLYNKNLEGAIGFYRKASELDPLSDTIRKKLALALSWSGKDEEAFPILSELHRKHPEDKDIAIEIARIYTKKQDFKKSASVINPLFSRYPDDREIILEIAGLECMLGHAKKCDSLYKKAIGIPPKDDKILLQFADSMKMWGDFYRAEGIYRGYLKDNPDSFDVSMKLARVLTSSERYEEAEGIYLKLLLKTGETTKSDDKKIQEILLGLATLKLLEKDFIKSKEYSQRILTKNPRQPDALLIKAEALLFLGQYNDAGQAFREVSDSEGYRLKGFIGIGRVYLRQNNPKDAQEYFQRAYMIKPENIEARFYSAGFDRVARDGYVEDILRIEKGKPASLTEWGDLYAIYGFNKTAIRLYEEAAKEDPDFFPAKSKLAELYGVDHQYERSIALYKTIQGDFPESSKILIGLARVLGWSKKYWESFELYGDIHKTNPSDPVPQKEGARTAFWGKMVTEAMYTYNNIMTPQVDSRLVAELTPVSAHIQDSQFYNDFNRLKEASKNGSVYRGYEQLYNNFKTMKWQMTAGERLEIENKLTDLLPVYKIQKSAYLESRAKLLAYEKRFSRSMPFYEELLRHSPGNEEAYFDYGQVECSLGLCNREKNTYKRLLNIDPLHNLAGIALERQRIRSNPSLGFDYSYWMEDGWGELAQIKRDRLDFTFDIPLFCQYHLNLALNKWFEHPKFSGRTYAANGYTIGASGNINPFFKASASWTYKRYTNNELSDRNTGYGNLWFNIKEYAHVGAGYERTDELYNEFGIQQGLQADSFWLGVRSDLTKSLEVEGKTKALWYNDSNSGQHHFLAAKYAFTDHPKIFKITLSGEYRNTKHENLYVYQGTNLINIIHPYWTPKNYTGTGITLEWYHDYSRLFFCGNQLRFYDIKVSLGADSENNPSARIEAEWHHQFYNHWTIGIKGMLHSSPKWDANGLWATLKYQF